MIARGPQTSMVYSEVYSFASERVIGVRIVVMDSTHKQVKL